jgi:hypothetical protein
MQTMDCGLNWFKSDSVSLFVGQCYHIEQIKQEIEPKLN